MVGRGRVPVAVPVEVPVGCSGVDSTNSGQRTTDRCVRYTRTGTWWYVGVGRYVWYKGVRVGSGRDSEVRRVR